MRDPAYSADTIIQEVFTHFSSQALPPHLGWEIYLTIRRRLHASRYLDDEHADEVFQRVVVEAYSYLARHGSHEIRHTRGWLHRISLNATRHYLSECSRVESLAASALKTLIESGFQDFGNCDDIERVRKAIGNLLPRYQEILRLDLVEGLPSREVQKNMKIASNAYFRRLKCEAIKALRKEISRPL